MHRSIDQTTTGSPKRFEKDLWRAICGTALTVAAVAGVAGALSWHAAGHAASARPATVPAPVSTTISRNITPAAAAFTFYLVNSEAQPASLEALLQVQGSDSVEPAGPGHGHSIAAVSSPEDLVRIQAAAAEIENATIVDLRASESSAAAPEAIGEDDIRVYLVGSQEQADAIASGRLNAGVPPEDAEIVRSGSPEEAKWARNGVASVAVLDIAGSTVGSDEEASQTRATLNTASRLRRGDDKSGIRVIDLREP